MSEGSLQDSCFSASVNCGFRIVNCCNVKALFERKSFWIVTSLVTLAAMASAQARMDVADAPTALATLPRSIVPGQLLRYCGFIDRRRSITFIGIHGSDDCATA